MKNLVEPDIVPLARFARENGFRSALHRVHAARCAESVGPHEGAAGGRHHRNAVARDLAADRRCPIRDPRAPATEYAFADGVGTVGFIASVSRPFCLNCNRIRLTADGKLRYCLFAIEEDDVKALLRSGASDDEIAALVRRNVAGKWIGHEINSGKFVAPPRPMYSIGG